jgi:hypothetical protein
VLKKYFIILIFFVNDVYGRERNPGINAIGLLAGLQL